MKKWEIQRWLSFARRMAFHAWPVATRARKRRLWKECERFIRDLADEPVDGWQGKYCLLDYFEEFFEDYASDLRRSVRSRRGRRYRAEYFNDDPNKFFNQLRCILRASVNVVFQNDPAGVIGFTVGDIKCMFGGRIPKWFRGQYPGLTNKSRASLTIHL